MTPQEFLSQAVAAAIAAEHIWPDYAACEAALESGWGESKLAKDANNLFGTKAPKAYRGPSIVLPTREYEHGKMVPATARWVKYLDWNECFRERMALLHRLAPTYPDYAAALAAGSGVDFVRNVSRTWATDPRRADKVLGVYKAHMHDIAAAVAAVRIAPDPSGENV